MTQKAAWVRVRVGVRVGVGVGIRVGARVRVRVRVGEEATRSPYRDHIAAAHSSPSQSILVVRPTATRKYTAVSKPTAILPVGAGYT